MYWDFGTGQVGDMGSHTMDLAWNALDAELPTAAEASGDPVNPEVSPVKLQMTFQLPANGWRPALPVTWYQGGAMPESPNDAVDLSKIGHGAMFKGTKGVLVSSFDDRILLPNDEDGDLTYYKRREKGQVLPRIANFQREWLDACRGSLKTSCDFDYGGKMIEMMLLGLAAYRAGQGGGIRRRQRARDQFGRGGRAAAPRLPKRLDAQRIGISRPGDAVFAGMRQQHPPPF